MGLKKSGLRGSLRNVSVGVLAIPDMPVLLPESNDLDNFAGDLSAFDINDSPPVFDGLGNNDLSLKSSASGIIGSSSGLDNYPTVGDPHTFAYLPNANDSAFRVQFGSSGSSNETSVDTYGIQFNINSDLITLFRLDGGSLTEIDETAVNYDVGEFVVVRDIFHESNGDISFRLDDADGTQITTLSGNDSTHITDGSYDNSNIQIRNLAGNADVLDRWVFE